MTTHDYTFPLSAKILHSGMAANVVPDFAEATFDVRLTPGCNPLRVDLQIDQAAR